LAKSSWEIENKGFNDAKNRYDFEHLCHHPRNSLLLGWLLAALALNKDRLPFIEDCCVSGPNERAGSTEPFPH
jgi:hypothetical protein